MPPFFFRSMLFNFLFYALTAVSCVLLLPTLLLPRKAYLAVVYGFVYTTAFLEKYVLGLTYEIRGAEHLPVSGSYLVAAKHQSAYETTKLHILFHDPAIVLKKELLKIPLWGQYLAKSDVISIDRSTPKAAVESIQAGAKRMAAQGRPIVIFPQGTRVSIDTTTEEKPYKIGIIRMQESTGLPIIPMALNTGVFWPRNSLFKKPGRVVFQFLPPMMPGTNSAEMLKKLQHDMEEASKALIKEAQKSLPKHSMSVVLKIAVVLLLVAAWCANWVIASSITQNAVRNFMAQIQASPDFEGSTLKNPRMSGFPFKITLTFGLQKIMAQGQSFEIESMTAQSWPFMGFPITISAGPVSIMADGWSAPVVYDDFEGKVAFSGETFTIDYATLKKSVFEGSTSGKVIFSTPYPQFDLLLSLKNHEAMIASLMASHAVKKKEATMAGVMLSSMQDQDNMVSLKVTSMDRNVYLGPLRVYQFPDVTIKPAVLEDGTTSHFATRRQKPDATAPSPAAAP